MAFIPPDNFPTLKGYSRFELLYESPCISVFRALWQADQRSVVIKFLRADSPSFSQLVQFRNQYAITQNLPISGIVAPLAFEPWGNGYALVMEDFGGISLRSYAHGRELPWQDVCAIALQLSDILHDLCKHRVVHKDIKPTNILIHPETQQVKLIDFGIASLLPRESQELQSPGDLAGSLAYLAPEQTGRMNRGIDYRADFYSLGVTLYELLTGQLPFESEDPMELVHCHLAKAPMLPHVVNGHIPVQISEIVLKLMAKNAEDRYQSVVGLKHDLQRCLEQWETTGKIPAFALGQRDVGDRFLMPEKLYGREADVQNLLDAFERVSQGASELMLVAGYAGVGKTAVVNEIHKPITQKKGYFIQGKFDQFNRNVPFSAFVQAFRSLVGQLLGESDAALADWKAKVLAAVGGQGQVLIDVIPELALIIGPQPEVPELSGIAAQNRFNWLLGQFIQVFARPDHPLTVFLDDLQWVDSASLRLLKLLMSPATAGAATAGAEPAGAEPAVAEPAVAATAVAATAGAEPGYLLVLGAYRDHEVFAAHPLMLTLDELRHRTVQTLTLAPLTTNDIHQLVAESLHCSVDIAAPLAELVYQKTGGNPFFATQFLQGLQADGWITFNVNVGHWQCDLSQIRALALTDDVVEFMVRRLQQWPKATQNALAIAACLGNQFDLATLSIICEQSPEALAQVLWLALQAGLLIPENETYKLFQTLDAAPTNPPTPSHGVTATYRFLHDRVQQAAYAFIPAGEKRQTHSRIGRYLLDHLPPEKQEDSIFDIVNQLNIGRDLVSNADEQHQLIALNLQAGIKAKSATAYGAALVYFEIAIELLSADGWQQNYPLALELYENAAEAASLSGNGDRMEALVQTVVTEARTSLDTVKTLQMKMQYCLGHNQPLVTIEIARSLLQQLGVVLPDSLTMEAVQQELKTVKQVADQYSYDQIVDLPILTDPEKLAILSTLMLVTTSLMIVNPNLYLLVALITTQFSLEYGHSSFTPYVYGLYAILLKNLEQDIDQAYDWGNLAVRLLHTPIPKIFENRVYHTISAFITHEKRHVETTLSVFQQAYTNGVENGDFEFSGYSIYLRCYNLYFLGRALSTVKQAIIQTNEALSSIGQHLPITWNQCFYQTVLELSGTEDDSDSLARAPFDAVGYVQSKQAQNDGFGLCYFYFNQATLGYILGDYSQALAASTLAKQYLAGPAGMLTEVLVYFYDSLIWLACANGLDAASELAKVRENQQKMKRWADNAPMNFKHKYELICAEEQRLLGDRLAAMDFYDRAIAGAKEHAYLQEEALANELAAKFYLGWGKTKIAAVYMQEAYYCYDRWGAKAKTKDLATRYADLLRPMLEQNNGFDPLTTLYNIAPLNLSVHSSLSSAQSATGNNAALDLAMLFKAAQTFSASANLNELLEKLTAMMLQTSGAERLALLLPDVDRTWQVRVSATIESTQLVADPLADYPHLPVRLIQYGLRTEEILAVDGSAPLRPVVDPYLQQHPHGSVLCMPFRHQSKLIGLLYLEHQSVTGVFSRDRIAVLNFLCNQAAISLENALLKQALEEKLEASETLFRHMVDNIPGVVYQVHIAADGAVSTPYVSPDCYALYGVSAEAIMSGQYSLRDFEYGADRPMVDQTIAEMSQSLQPGAQEFRIMTPSGTLKWVQVFTSPTAKPDGTTLWDGIVMDVSDRKQVEQKLKFTQFTLDNFVDHVLILKMNGQIIDANPSCCESLGYSYRELCSMTLFDICPEAMERWSDFSEAVRQNKSLDIESLHQKKSGEIFPVEVVANFLEYDGEEYIVGIIRDITERKATQKSMSLAKFAVDNTAMEILWINKDGIIVDGNKAACQNLGYSPDELKQLPLANISPNFTYEKLRSVWPKLKENGFLRFESMHQTKAGKIHPVEITSNYLEYEEEEFIFSQCIDISDRKAAELALKNSQDQFRHMTDNIPGMIYRYVLHPDGNDELTYVSPQVKEIFELEPDIALENTEQVWGRIHPDDIPWLGEAIQASAKTLQPFTSAYRLILPDKGLRWVQNLSSAERLSNGDVVWDGIVQDVTELKHYEQQLQDLSARLELAINSTQIGIWEWNFQEHRLSWDQRMFEIYGTPPEMFEGTYQDWERCVHPEDLEHAQSRGDDEDLAEREFRIIRPDGSIRHVASTVILQYDDQGQPLRAVGTNIDISDRKTVALALEQEVLRRTTIFDTCSDGIHILDLEGNLLEANISFLRSLGYTAAEAKHLNCGDWDAQTPLEKIQAGLQNYPWQTAGVMTIEALHRRQDGSIFPVEISICAMEWYEQRSFICISRNISQRKQAEEELQRTNEELMRATRLKDEFLANMSHELRTPLNSILGLSEALQDPFFGPLTEKQIQFLKIIEESGQHLLSLINDILDVAKIESGQFDLNLTLTDINCLCESSLAFVTQEAVKKNISLTTEKPPESLSVFLDERRMIQSLVNLLNNAVKFTLTGGSVVLKVSFHMQDGNGKIVPGHDMGIPVQPQNRVVWESGELQAQSYISISVTDTGIGISPEQFPKLFKPFSQVESTLNRTYAGTGLGLVLVKQIAELHGGTVSVVSEVNQGSCFSINIPCEPITPLTKPSQSSDEISQLSLIPSDQVCASSLILLADDNKNNVHMLVSFLEKIGYRLIVASNGLEAINLAQKYNPDLILMDIQMPEFNGYEAIQQIRQNMRLKDTPIIALTALAMPEDRKRCLAAGANHYLSQPVPMNQLVLAIRKFLDR